MGACGQKTRARRVRNPRRRSASVPAGNTVSVLTIVDSNGALRARGRGKDLHDEPLQTGSKPSALEECGFWTAAARGRRALASGVACWHASIKRSTKYLFAKPMTAGIVNDDSDAAFVQQAITFVAGVTNLGEEYDERDRNHR